MKASHFPAFTERAPAPQAVLPDALFFFFFASLLNLWPRVRPTLVQLFGGMGDDSRRDSMSI